MSHTIGGNITIKNGISWDYCFEQCIESLLPICSVINVVDSDSTDGTRERLNDIVRAHSKVRVLNYEWPGKPGDRDCILDKMNWSRERLGTHYHLHLEADEVLSADSYPYIIDAACEPASVLGMERLNFWGDAFHLLLPGRVLSPQVIRFAPTAYWLGGDAPHPKATQTEPEANWGAMHFCKIFHYGFMRKSAAYVGKYADLMRNINGSEAADPGTLEHLKRCAETGENWMTHFNFGTIPFTGHHPASMVQWLRERGRL